MAKRGRPRQVQPYTSLYYDSIRLVPADTRRTPRSWHVPGGTQATTTELVKRAKARGVSVVLEETTRKGTRTRLLT